MEYVNILNEYTRLVETSYGLGSGQTIQRQLSVQFASTVLYHVSQKNTEKGLLVVSNEGRSAPSECVINGLARVTDGRAEQMDGQIDRRMDGRMGVWIDRQWDGRTGGCVERQTAGWTDGREKRMDGRTDLYLNCFKINQF